MDTELDVVKARLNRAEHRLTAPRQRIVNAVFATHDHFTVEELQARLKRQGERVSRATIYRTLSLLKELRLVEEHDFGQDAKRYEHVYGHKHHDHLICVKCGRIEEFRSETIEAAQAQVAKRRGFRMTHHTHKIFGFCVKCH